MKKNWVSLILILTFLSCGKQTKIPSSDAPSVPLWYKNVVFYQIFPRSFKDTNSDGIGDLNGITEKLDYLKELGVGGIWLNPIYPSPLSDSGYDVADYTAIHQDYGTMNDFEILIEEAHRRNIKVFLDMVFNHTSQEHPWFKESRSSLDNSKRDWYIWAPQPFFTCKDIPSAFTPFGEIRWTYDPLTGEYYFHQFRSTMPDLNFRNPEVQNALLDVARFWLEKGVDGFRLDVPHSYVEDETNSLCAHQPETHEFLKKLRALMDEYDNRALVGEVWGLPDDIIKYLGNGRNELHMIFNFILTFVLYETVLFEGKATLEEVLRETFLRFPPGGWHAIAIGNHDIPRSFSILGKNRKKAETIAFLQLTLPGTPFIYYGEEIGISNGTDIHIDWRDIARTPMQWSDSKYGGFSDVKPWISLSPDCCIRNVEAELKTENSLLSFYKKLIRMRNAIPALRGESFLIVDNNETSIFSFIKGTENDHALIIVNLSGEKKAIEIDLQETPLEGAKSFVDIWNNEQLYSSSGNNLSLTLNPFEKKIILKKEALENL